MNEVEWSRMTAPELRETAQRGAVVIVPIGAIEQHGPHLPVDVDIRLAHAASLAAARIAPSETPIIVAPPQSVGLSQHHISFGGTLTLDFAAFYAVLFCICRSIIDAGFDKIALVNGHGGNTNPLKVVVNEMVRGLNAAIVSCHYKDVAVDAYRKILEVDRCMMHGCEAETSLIMAVAPDLVRRTALEDLTAPSFESDEDPFEAAFYRSIDMDEISENGVLGTPMAATPEKGRQLLEASAQGLVDQLCAAETWCRMQPTASASANRVLL